jgi:hypothetical protein
MRKATRIVAAAFGIVAGLAGLEHGVFEILQGNVRPAGFMFPSMGAPCIPEQAWSACEPAVSVLPNLLIAGILTVIVGLLILVWSAAFVQRKHGGLILILLSVLLILVGGGVFPPLFGVIGGVAGISINKPITGKPGGSIVKLMARVWPWPLIIFMVWALGQFPFGYFFNDLLKSIIGYGLLLMVAMLPLSLYTAYARDARLN